MMKSRKRRLPKGLALGALAAVLLTMVMASAYGAGTDWYTYHHDAARSGVDPTQPGPTASVTPGWTSPGLDGQVFAEPLAVDGLVIAATEGNTLYALNPATGAIVWSRNLGAPVNSSGFPCGDINPIGITGTPVVDLASGTLYAVAFLAPSHHELFAVNVANGTVAWHRPVDAPGADPVVHNQRGALAISAGRIYIPFGGRAGDCGQYQGRLVAVQADGTGPLLSYTVPTAREGGMWGPAGPTVDPATGDVLVSTGNSASTSSFDFGESVIRFSPTLAQLDYFAPANWASLNAGDTDIGSVGPTLLAGNRVFQVGKEGVGYLLQANHLGGIGGQVFSAQVCNGGGAFGGTAYQASYVYVPCTDGLAAVKVDAAGNSFSVAWRGPSGFAGPPIVAGGMVWTVQRSGTLYGLNPTDGAVMFHATVANFTHFATPSAGSGQVFVAANGGVTSFVLHPVVNPKAQSYWLVSADGGIFTYGNAGFYGSAGGMHLNRPIVAMAVTPDRHGYWLAGTDGGIFSYGDAHFFGSTGGMALNQPVVGMAPTPTGKGYWLVASDGGIFSFGDAAFHGSAGSLPLNSPIAGMAPTPTGGGYWLVAADGGIFNYGDAPFFGSAAGSPHSFVAMAHTPTGKGYWLAASDGAVANFGDASFLGSAAGHVVNAPVVGMAS